MQSFVKPLVATLTLGALAACATVTGPDAASRFDSFQTESAGDFTAYTSVYVAPVVVTEEITDRIGYRARSRVNDPIRPLTERDIMRKTADLDRFLARALSEKATLADEPGVGILTVEAIITDLDANRPTQGDLTDNPGLSFNSRYAGGAAATVTFKEGDMVLATAEDRAVGTLDLRDVPESTWYEADQFFMRLSDKIAALLGE